MHTGRNATNFLSSIRVTNTAVARPFFENVAAVVAPIASSAVVRFLPATVSAFASAGGVATAGEELVVGAGEAETEAEGEGAAVGVAEALGVGDELGVGVDFATGFAGAFFTGFFGGFFELFLVDFFATGFFAAIARSPRKNAEATPATMVMNFRRPPLPDSLVGLFITL